MIAGSRHLTLDQWPSSVGWMIYDCKAPHNRRLIGSILGVWNRQVEPLSHKVTRSMIDNPTG